MFQRESFRHIIGAIGLPPGKNAEAGLTRYINELETWNRRVNLVSRKSAGNIWEEHVVPSLVYALFMKKGGKYIDIGTGAGLPGLVLKIVFPDLSIDLIDSNRKKTLFCKYMINELKIAQTKVIIDRVQNQRQVYDGALFRAVSDLNVLQDMARTVVKTGGHLITLKGASENLTGDSTKFNRVEIPDKLKNQSLRLTDSIIVISII